MKKSFYYNFIPSKAEEEASKLNHTPHQITRVLVEIRDVYPPPAYDFQNPSYYIRRALTHYEVVTGKLVISFVDAFEHVFRYWTLCMANHVVLGRKMPLDLMDFTEESNPKRYHNEAAICEILPNEDYIIACMDLFKDRYLNVDDEIGLCWDVLKSCFRFKLFRRAVLI